MTANLDISGPPIDAMTGWHGVMVNPASIHAEVKVKIAKMEFVTQLCPDMVFSTSPINTGQITPYRALLLRTGQQPRCATAVVQKPVNDAHLILPEGWKLDLTAGQSDTKLHESQCHPRRSRAITRSAPR